MEGQRDEVARRRQLTYIMLENYAEDLVRGKNSSPAGLRLCDGCVDRMAGFLETEPETVRDFLGPSVLEVNDNCVLERCWFGETEKRGVLDGVPLTHVWKLAESYQRPELLDGAMNRESFRARGVIGTSVPPQVPPCTCEESVDGKRRKKRLTRWLENGDLFGMGWKSRWRSCSSSFEDYQAAYEFRRKSGGAPSEDGPDGEAPSEDGPDGEAPPAEVREPEGEAQPEDPPDPPEEMREPDGKIPSESPTPPPPPMPLFSDGSEPEMCLRRKTCLGVCRHKDDCPFNELNRIRINECLFLSRAEEGKNCLRVKEGSRRLMFSLECNVFQAYANCGKGAPEETIARAFRAVNLPEKAAANVAFCYPEASCTLTVQTVASLSLHLDSARVVHASSDGCRERESWRFVFLQPRDREISTADMRSVLYTRMVNKALGDLYRQAGVREPGFYGDILKSREASKMFWYSEKEKAVECSAREECKNVLRELQLAYWRLENEKRRDMDCMASVRDKLSECEDEEERKNKESIMRGWAVDINRKSGRQDRQSCNYEFLRENAAIFLNL